MEKKDLRDTKVVEDVKEDDVNVTEKMKGELKTFFKKNYKAIILGTVATAGVAYIGKTVLDVKNGKYDLLDDDEEELKLVEGNEPEATDDEHKALEAMDNYLDSEE